MSRYLVLLIVGALLIAGLFFRLAGVYVYTPNPELNNAANAFLEYTDQPPTDSYYYFVGFAANDDPIESGKTMIATNHQLPTYERLKILWVDELYSDLSIKTGLDTRANA